MAISEQWAELLAPGLRQIFQVQRDALAARSVIPILFNVSTSTKATEDDLGMGGFADWEEYDGAIQYDDNEQLYKTTYTHKEYVQAFRVERKLYDDDQYNVINKRPVGLALAAMRTREKHAASVFNNAFSGSYLGGDGVALCSNSHPYSNSNASTQDNSGTSAFSHDNVVATRQLMREYKDDRGELVSVNPDTILVPPELEDEAFETVQSVNKSGESSNTINYVKSIVSNVVVWDYLTDANNWFVLDSALAKLYLNWFDRVPLEFDMDPTSDFRLEARYRGYGRWSYGWSDWRFCYGHTVT
jgi:phage major head subunit gpT-like protein